MKYCPATYTVVSDQDSSLKSLCRLSPGHSGDHYGALPLNSDGTEATVTWSNPPLASPVTVLELSRMEGSAHGAREWHTIVGFDRMKATAVALEKAQVNLQTEVRLRMEMAKEAYSAQHALGEIDLVLTNGVGGNLAQAEVLKRIVKLMAFKSAAVNALRHWDKSGAFGHADDCAVNMVVGKSGDAYSACDCGWDREGAALVENVLAMAAS